MIRATFKQLSSEEGMAATLSPPSQPMADAAAREEETRRRRIGEIIAEVDRMVGLSNVKALVREVTAFCEIQRLRAREHLITQPTTLHMIFTGHPGTGKTTMARAFGKLFKELGVLSKGHLVEVERADLVGEYIGHTAQRTRDQIKKALGGILFIDEAYSLARGGDKDFGREAIDCLVRGMENNKDEIIVILAGYPHEMGAFLQTNPGLRSRLPIILDFPDYCVDELVRIGELMLEEKEYRMDVRARTKLMALVSQRQMEDDNPGNARTVRNLVEKAIRQQAVRLMDYGTITREQLLTLRAEDFRMHE